TGSVCVNDPATSACYPPSLHDALPIFSEGAGEVRREESRLQDLVSSEQFPVLFLEIYDSLDISGGGAGPVTLDRPTRATRPSGIRTVRAGSSSSPRSLTPTHRRGRRSCTSTGCPTTESVRAPTVRRRDRSTAARSAESMSPRPGRAGSSQPDAWP